MMFSRLGCWEQSAFVDSLIPATSDQQDQWVISGERSVEMDGEIEKGARAPISQGHPGSSLAAALMTFPADGGGLGAWGLEGEWWENRLPLGWRGQRLSSS